MSVDCQTQDAQPLLQVKFPDRRVPFRRLALKNFCAPDIINQYVNLSEFALQPLPNPLTSSGTR